MLRQVAVEGDKIVVRTYGEGNNRTPALAAENAVLGRAAFVLATRRMRSELKPPAENGRWDDRRTGAKGAQGFN